jgi:predicted deacylase
MRKTQWVRATRSGIATIEVDPGSRVAAKQVIGTIGEALGGRRAMIRAPADGHVIAINQNPLVSQGDAMVHVGVIGAVGRDEPAERRLRRRS